MTDSPFGALHHVGLVVPDLQPTVGNLCALLVGRVVDKGSDDQLAAAWTWIESNGNPIMEVVAPIGESGPIARYLERHGPGLHHVSFQPERLDDALAHVRGCGFDVIGEDRSHSGFEEFFVAPEATGRALLHAFRELKSSVSG